jgi:hypothetical protein
MTRFKDLKPVGSGFSPPGRFVIIAPVALGAILLLFLTSPAYQDPSYHNFIDRRSMNGLPNALNVLSNITFFMTGLYGVILVIKRTTRFVGIDVIYLVFFISVILIGFGSAYYHWSPDNLTLVWDRLPMTVAFMTFTSIVVTERYSKASEIKLFPWLIAVGVFSVIYWSWTGDLRLYIAIQFGPILFLPLLIWKYPGPGTSWLWLTILMYIAAKLFEVADQQIYHLTGDLVSGHTLKHLAGAAGVLLMVNKYRLQKPRRTVSCSEVSRIA